MTFIKIKEYLKKEELEMIPCFIPQKWLSEIIKELENEFRE